MHALPLCCGPDSVCWQALLAAAAVLMLTLGRGRLRAVPVRIRKTPRTPRR